MSWDIPFLTEEQFRKHICDIIGGYGAILHPMNLAKFNENLIDPIKLIFDRTVYHLTWEEVVRNEIFRQRDKSNNNRIGYFHQRLFQHIEHCTVPSSGWDVVFAPPNGIILPDIGHVSTIYVEMKNKHNTMNSTAKAKTYMKMQSQLLTDDDCVCFLVEVLAQKSQNIPWSLKVDSEHHSHKRIRQVSIDQFYAMITGEENAFYRICSALPETIEEIVRKQETDDGRRDTVIEELQSIIDSTGGSYAMALYMLGFSTYTGFGK